MKNETNTTNTTNTQNPRLAIEKKLDDMMQFDPDIAAVIFPLMCQQCIFCKLSAKCSERKKRTAIEENKKSEDYCLCEDFQIDPVLCKMMLEDYLQIHPNREEQAITCKTTAELD